MIAQNQTIDNQAAIRIEGTIDGFRVHIGTNMVGVVETYQAWELDITPDGIEGTNLVYVTDHVTYATPEQATGQVVAAWLTAGCPVNQPEPF